jgi:hypothetical protein
MSGLLQFPTGILVLVFLTYFVSAVLDLLSIFIAFLHKRGLALRTFYWESLFVLFAVNLLFGFLLPAIGPVAADDAEYVLLLPLLLALAGIFFQRRYLLVSSLSSSSFPSIRIASSGVPWLSLAVCSSSSKRPIASPGRKSTITMTFRSSPSSLPWTK